MKLGLRVDDGVGVRVIGLVLWVGLHLGLEMGLG